MCYFFSVNKKLFHSVRSTVSLRAQRGNLPEGIPHCNIIRCVAQKCNPFYLSLRLSQSMSDISSRTMQRNFKRHSVSDTVRSRVSIVATDRARFVSSMTLSRESSISQFMLSRRTLCFFSTQVQVSCVGFITRCPFPAIATLRSQ